MAATKRKATHVTTPNGGRIYVSANTKKELEQKKRDAMMLNGAPVKGATFREYGEVWLKAYKAPPKMRETSYSTLTNIYRNHILSYFGDMRIADVSPIQIQLWMNTIAHLSRSVQSKCVQYVRGIFNTAADNGLILKSPVSSQLKPGGAGPEKEEALTDEQARRLLNAVEGTKAYLFILIALSTGMRRGEILGLMWEDIDFENGFITVTHNKAFPNDANDAPVTTMLKTDAAKRKIPVGGKLLEELKKYKAYSISDYVISMENGESMTKGAFRGMWEIVEHRTVGDGKKMGDVITGGRVGNCVVCIDFPVHPHLLRHTFCTQCIEAGMGVKEVQYIMGHANPDVTMKIYAHYRQKSQESETAERVRNVVSYL